MRNFCAYDKEQSLVLNITVYRRMCLFTILMLNVCGVTIFYGNTTDKQDFQDKMEIISPWLYFICLSCEEFRHEIV
jgi:hypothetical protein